MCRLFDVYRKSIFQIMELFTKTYLSFFLPDRPTLSSIQGNIYKLDLNSLLIDNSKTTNLILLCILFIVFVVVVVVFN